MKHQDAQGDPTRLLCIAVPVDRPYLVSTLVVPRRLVGLVGPIVAKQCHEHTTRACGS